MYTINGIDLQSSEYDELKLLVEAHDRGEDVEALASQRLRPEGSLDDGAFEVYVGLESVGLVSGCGLLGGFDFSGLTQRGIDFIHDYEKSVEGERKKAREQRIHDYKVALFSFGGGAVSGGAITLILHFAFGL